MTINLQGIAIGKGLVDPLEQLNFIKESYTVGFLDATNLYGKKESFKNMEDFFHKMIREGKYDEVYMAFNYLMAYRDEVLADAGAAHHVQVHLTAEATSGRGRSTGRALSSHRSRSRPRPASCRTLIQPGIRSD
ncbi:hypothetical protein TKK_0015382 [Trichogramma kaykai]